MCMKQIKPLLYKNYLALIKNSLKAKVWRNFYVIINKKVQDILHNGDLSCAFFVSSLLVLFGLIQRIHTTVNGTLKDMEHCGWQRIKKPKIGSILLWEAKSSHKHLGFFMGKKKAISNSSKNRVPIKHHWTFGEKNGQPKRKIEAIFWHRKLDLEKYKIK